MLDALAHRERLAERALRMLALAERFERQTPGVGGVGLAPGVSAFGRGGEVERLTRGGERPASVGPGEVDRRQRDEQFDLPQPVAAQPRLAQAVVGLGPRAVQVTAGQRGARGKVMGFEDPFHVAGAGGPGADLVDVLDSGPALRRARCGRRARASRETRNSSRCAAQHAGPLR